MEKWNCNKNKGNRTTILIELVQNNINQTNLGVLFHKHVQGNLMNSDLFVPRTPTLSPGNYLYILLHCLAQLSHCAGYTGTSWWWMAKQQSTGVHTYLWGGVVCYSGNRAFLNLDKAHKVLSSIIFPKLYLVVSHGLLVYRHTQHSVSQGQFKSHL